MISAENSVNIHLFLKVFKHLNNFCKILSPWILNLMLELFIKLIHQINTVINCSSSIIVHIFMIEKNLNYLPNSSTSSCFSWCRKNHTHLRFYKLIICSVIRTGFSMPLPTITATTSLPRVPPNPSPRISSFVISSTFCTTSTALASVLDSTTERKNLKASLTLIWVKRETSEENRFKNKSLLLTKHCWSKCDHKF